MGPERRSAPHAQRVGMLAAGVVLAVVGAVIMFGYRVETCSDGPLVSSCTSGPAPLAVPIGVIVIGAGVLIAVWATRRPR